MQEIYKDLGFTNNLYSVSNLGNVKRAGKVLKPIIKNGYNSVGLSISGRVKVHYMHRLVANEFLENPNNLPQVNHKNGLKTDNRVENLEWVTNRENVIHSVSVLGRKITAQKGEKNGMYKYRAENNKNSKPVICSNGQTYGSRKEAARVLGVNAGNISNICNGKRKSIKGYSFKWA